MLTRSPTLRNVVGAVAFVISAFCLSLFVWHQFGGVTPLKAKGYRIAVEFTQAQNLLPNADVRVSGVTIGKVVEVSPGAKATRALLEIKPRFAPLHRDVQAIVRVKTLLGESFVALTPGSAVAPVVPDGGTLPLRNVRRPQLLDEVLSAFDARTRQALLTLLSGSAQAVQGRGADINDALGHLGPTADQLDQLLTVLDAQRDDLAPLLSGSATTLDAVARHPDALQRLVRSGQRLVSTTANSRRRLSQTIGTLPELERQTRSTSAELAGAARDAAPTINALTAVRAQLSPALTDGTKLAEQAHALLRRLQPTLRLARSGLAPGSRLLQTIPPLMTQLYGTGRDLAPLVQLVGAYKREVVGALANYAASGEATAMTATGAPRHYIRGMNIVNNELYQLYAKRPASNRHNAYPPPGWLQELGTGGLRTADCQNLGNGEPKLDPTAVIPSVTALIPAILGSPPCRAEPPWSFGGQSRSYPHVARAK